VGCGSLVYQVTTIITSLCKGMGCQKVKTKS
jgi:hypothetical protein